MKYVCPLIVVNDIEISRRFYEEVLNQQVKYDYGENVTFEGDFAIHLKSHYQGLIGNKEIIPYSNGFELYFEHDDLVLIYEQETDAPAPAPAPAPVPVKADACARPSYLKGYQNG